MKILLIDPPFYRIMSFCNRYFPYGLVSLGTYLKEQGHNVLVYDADYNDRPENFDYTQLPKHYPTYLESFKNNHPIWKEVKKTIRDFNPHMVGISIWTTYAASAFYVAKICKEIGNIPVTVGGPHAIVRADEILKICPAIDCAYTGQAPETVPFPNRSLLLNEAKYTPEDMGLIMTSTGCPYSCSYCAIHSQKVTYRPVENIIAEVEYVKNKYKTTQIAFKDDSFTVNKKRLWELCDGLKKLKVGWECNTRIDLISKGLLEKIKYSGCNHIKVGIESGSERILQQMNKGTTLEQIRYGAKLLRESRIYWTGYFMTGIPGETAEDVYSTLYFMQEIKPDFASLGIYESFPGTKMFDESVEMGLAKPDMTLNDFYTILPNHYYLTEKGQFHFLEKVMKQRFRNYNKNYRRLLKRACSRMRLYKNPLVLFRDIRKYLQWK